MGAGHNGLVAANVLADAGWSVLVLEAEPEPGGAVRSSELIEPGFVHDRFSAFFPIAAASPVFRRLGLAIPFRHGPLVLAHPAADGTCAVLERDGGDARWRRLEPAILRGLETPFPQVRAALMLALEADALTILRPPADPLARRVRLGNSLHTDIPCHTLLAQAFGLVLTELGRRFGFPCVEGG